VRPLQQARCVQQGRFAGTGGRHKCHDLAAPEREISAVQDGKLARALHVMALDRLQLDNGLCHHSYLSASTGSSLAARQAGNSVAMKDRPNAISTTENVSEKSILAGNWLRKYSSGLNNTVPETQEKNS